MTSHESSAPMRAVLLSAFGGPDALRYGTANQPEERPGSALIRVSRAGVNFFDTERRASGWLGAELPAILGAEVAGVRLRDGQRVVGLTQGGVGGYAEYATVPDELAVPIPDEVSDAKALAALIQGLTAWHLLQCAAQIRGGETVVVTAAAGGVGTMAVQLARRCGAGRVIALASTAHKRQSALDAGADVALESSTQGLAERVVAANHGKPVDVALESVAGPVFDALLSSLGAGGRLVAYGQASGASNVVEVDTLMDHSIGVIGFDLNPYLVDRANTRQIVGELLSGIGEGWLVVREGASYPLSAAADAHRAVSSGQTIGKISLRVDHPSDPLPRPGKA